MKQRTPLAAEIEIAVLELVCLTRRDVFVQRDQRRGIRLCEWRAGTGMAFDQVLDWTRDYPAFLASIRALIPRNG